MQPSPPRHCGFTRVPVPYPRPQVRRHTLPHADSNGRYNAQSGQSRTRAAGGSSAAIDGRSRVSEAHADRTWPFPEETSRKVNLFLSQPVLKVARRGEMQGPANLTLVEQAAFF